MRTPHEKESTLTEWVGGSVKVSGGRNGMAQGPRWCAVALGKRPRIPKSETLTYPSGVSRTLLLVRLPWMTEFWWRNERARAMSWEKSI